MLRVKPGATAFLDDVDRELLSGVEIGLPWKVLLHSASCDAEEAEMRILRLLQVGHLEGKAGEAHERRSSATFAAVTMPPPASYPANLISQPPAASASAPPSTPQPTRSAPPKSAVAACDALMRELSTRQSSANIRPVSGASFPPVTTSHPPSAGSLPPAAPRFDSLKPGAYGSALTSRALSGVNQRPVPPRPEQTPGYYRVGSDEAGAGRSLPPAEDKWALGPLADELARGEAHENWCAKRLRDARREELEGNLRNAITALQTVLSHLRDPRIRAELDRLESRTLRASASALRIQAIDAERSFKHQQAVLIWARILESNPNDAEAALHAAVCCLEVGDLRQAGNYARRATQLAPDSLTAHRVLLRFYKKTGMEVSAKRESEIIKKLAKGG